MSPMRPSSPATAVGAVLAVMALSGWVVREEIRSEAVPAPANVAADLGSTFMAQQVPQTRPRRGQSQEARQVRAGFDDPRGPRKDPDEIAGRFPFYWTRAIYSGSRGRGRGWGGAPWATDYPKGDQQFLIVLKRLVGLDAYDWDNAVSLADPEIRRHPVIYTVEVGYMNLTEPEVTGLRGYLDAGGFLIVDDFWGNRQWDAFEYNMRRVFPDRHIVPLDMDHEIFSTYYQIDEIKQVPARGGGIYGRSTSECYGCDAGVYGIFDDDGRLMVVINFNTDLGDAWEWAEDPYYPLEYSTYAYEMGANMIVYAMSH